MPKKILALSACLILAACGGGHRYGYAPGYGPPPYYGPTPSQSMLAVGQTLLSHDAAIQGGTSMTMPR